MESLDRNQSLSLGRQFELSQDVGINPTSSRTFGDVLNARFGRRDAMKGSLGAMAAAALFGPAALASRPARANVASAFAFAEVAAGVDQTHHIAEGYSADILIRWGDPVLPGAPEFDPMNQSADAQETQFGYNNDFLGFLPLPLGSDASDHGLLFANHEYTNAELMHPGAAAADGSVDVGAATAEQVEIELAAHGLSVVEVMRGQDGKWSVVKDSSYNRRFTMRSTPMTIAGPAAGHDRMKTSADPDGRTAIGTLNNCAGGMTPWGTVLTGEENFHGYFWGEAADDNPEARNHKRYGVGGSWYAWGLYHDRFDPAKEPNEANRFGWVVEIDPYDPASTPQKRTALGRFKHEGAESIVNADGRVVVYMGDDERFEYVYKFVSSGTFNPDDRASNFNLLDEGTLYVARFDDDGTVTWLPLVHGEGPLTAENGFQSQADVVIEARRAGDLLGATKMDRPEDVEPNPTTGKVYVMLTNNTRRKAEQVDAANPRAENAFGHIVEITAEGGDHAATKASWTILLKCGDPAVADVGATWHPETTANGWFGSPDNCAVDGSGRLWVATDGNDFEYSGRTDGVWAVDTEGEARGLSRLFFRVPIGAELCGPKFTPDDTTLFVAVQHPADGGEEWPEFGRASTFADPSTRWPDFVDGMPPRPSVVAITRIGGGKIGT